MILLLHSLYRKLSHVLIPVISQLDANTGSIKLCFNMLSRLALDRILAIFIKVKPDSKELLAIVIKLSSHPLSIPIIDILLKIMAKSNLGIVLKLLGCFLFELQLFPLPHRNFNFIQMAYLPQPAKKSIMLSHWLAMIQKKDIISRTLGYQTGELRDTLTLQSLLDYATMPCIRFLKMKMVRFLTANDHCIFSSF